MGRAGAQGAHLLRILLLRQSGIELGARKPDDAASDAARALSFMQAAIEPGTFSKHAGRAYLMLGRAFQKQGKRQPSDAAFVSAARHLESKG